MSAPRIKRLATSFSLVLGSIALTLLAVHAADRALGRWTRDPRLTAGLLFPPQVELAVKTYEYNYTIKTNNLGLRDEDYDPRKRPQVLIAAIGDSFTFGQGVNIQDTWVQRVEKGLRAKGLDVEILNLGQPGSSPPYYAQLAEEALPVLKPDLVLVGVLQSNDFETLDPKQDYDDITYRREPRGRATMRAWFLNLINLAYREQARQLADREQRSRGRWNLIQLRWKEDFQKYYASIDSYDEGARYSFLSLPTPIQDALRDGLLPPLMMYLCADSLRMQRQRWWDLEVDSPDMQWRIDLVARSLARIGRAAELWGGRTAVLSLLLMENTDPFARKTLYRLFGVLERPGLDDTRSDTAIHRAARRAGLPSHDVTAGFREAARQEPLFYPLDTHLNARGNEVLANLLEPVIERYVREITDR